MVGIWLLGGVLYIIDIAYIVPRPERGLVHMDHARARKAGKLP